MATHFKSRSPVHNLLASVVLIAAAILIFGGGSSVAGADEFPGFFLKTGKSVPRIGRRSGNFEDFFLKASKSVPRIGRRGGFAPPSIEPTGSWPRFGNTENFPGPSKRPSEFPAGGEEPMSWETFARVMEESPELWSMVAGYTPDAPPSVAGFDNDMWQREKRTGNVQGAV